jgi:hypothetical protein
VNDLIKKMIQQQHNSFVRSNFIIVKTFVERTSSQE